MENYKDCHKPLQPQQNYRLDKDMLMDKTKQKSEWQFQFSQALFSRFHKIIVHERWITTSKNVCFAFVTCLNKSQLWRKRWRLMKLFAFDESLSLITFLLDQQREVSNKGDLSNNISIEIDVCCAFYKF